MHVPFTDQETNVEPFDTELPLASLELQTSQKTELKLCAGFLSKQTCDWVGSSSMRLLNRLVDLLTNKIFCADSDHHKEKLFRPLSLYLIYCTLEMRPVVEMTWLEQVTLLRRKY